VGSVDIGPYIVDFYCPAVKLIIEIDGAHHLEEENKNQDRFRDSYLRELGLKVLRFSNSQVKNKLFIVKGEILKVLWNINMPKKWKVTHFEKRGLVLQN